MGLLWIVKDRSSVRETVRATTVGQTMKELRMKKAPRPSTETITDVAPVDVLAENAVGALWHICLTANSFVFPIYAEFEKEYDITRMEFVTMFALSHRPKLVATDIVRMTALPKNNISRGVNRLLQKGLIKSNGDSNDARRRFLELSKSGRALMNILLPRYSDRATGFLVRLDHRDRKELARLTLKLAAAITE